MAKKLIITADDYGLSKATNSAVLNAVQKGLVTSVHVLPNMVSEEDLKKLFSTIQENELNCGIGVHFNHSDGPSILQRDNTLTSSDNEKYCFNSIYEMRHTRINSYDVALELRAQFEKIADIIGTENIDAFSSHYNIHYLDRNHLKIMKSFAIPYQIPMRTTSLWRHEKKRKGYKKYPGETPMPIACNGLRLFTKLKSESTQDLMFTLAKRKQMRAIKEKMRRKGIKLPSVTTGHWFGQPSAYALNWLILQMERIHKRNLSVEVFTHLTDKTESLQTTYSSEERLKEYNVLTSEEVQKTFTKMSKTGNIELSSYRSALIH